MTTSSSLPVFKSVSPAFLIEQTLCLSFTDYKNIKGLSGALEDPHRSNISTIYSYENADKTWQLIEKFKGEGEAIFTQPQGIIKCAGGE